MRRFFDMLRFALPVLATLFISLLAWGIINEINNEPQDADFSPLELNPFVLPAEVTIGEPTLVTNGLCNTTDEDVTARTTLLAQNVDDSNIRLRLVPPETEPNSYQLTVVPANECLGEVVLDGPFPPVLEPGIWRLATTVTVMGSGSQRQTLQVTSDPFIVHPENESQ